MTEKESSCLFEHQNQVELMEELNLNSHIDFAPNVLFGSGNDSNMDLETKD